MCVVSTAEVSTDAQESLWVLLYTVFSLGQGLCRDPCNLLATISWVFLP